MKYSILFSLSILCLLETIIRANALLIVNAQLDPSYRKLHSAVPIEKKLYIFGGFNSPILTPENETNLYNQNPDDRFFYLDVSNPFDTSNLPWRSVPNNVINLPLGSLSSIATGGVAASIGGANNDTIFFFNNERDDATKSVPTVHSYNSSNNVWNTQIFSGNRPIGRNQMRAVTDNNGQIYLLTGFDFTVQGVTRSNGLFVCDTINLNCVIKDAPLSRLGYGVTLLPNGHLVYMGGGDRNYAPVSDGFKTIYLYDPINDKWDSKITTGKILPDDVGITTALGLKGDRIILFGGNNGDDNNLYVLSLKNYEWFVPKVRGKGPVRKRGEHCANVIGKYMVITFGSNGVNDAIYKESGESDVLLLDISNDSEYVWTTTFDPTPLTKNFTSSNPSTLNPRTNNMSISIIIGLTFGLIIFFGILLGIIFFVIRYKNTNKAIPTPGNIVKDGGIMTIPSDYELSHGKYRI